MKTRLAAVLGLAGALAIGGCHCGKKTDEEILRERIDKTSVHLYVATKIAVTKADSSPEVADARKHLFEVLEVLRKAPTKTPPPAGAPSPAPSMLPAKTTPTASPTAPAPPPIASPSLGAADYAKLALALWKLRAEGKKIVQSGREDDLPPVLPILLRGADLPPPTMALFDTDTEHALFLFALFLVKFHPRSPAPVPDELLLYEAWRTRSDTTRLEGFAPITQSMKAIVYGLNELCDLAAAEGARADVPSRGSASEGVRALSGGKASLTPAQADSMTLAARALAHGTAGICYLDRGERPKAASELEKFVTAAHGLGAPPSETALLRAYIAMEKGDHDAAKKCLEEARDAPTTDPETRKQIEALLPRVARNDDGALRKLFGKASFTIFAVGVIWRQLDRAGVLDALAELEVVRTLRGYAQAAAGALGDARHTIPSFGDVKANGGDLHEKLGK